MDRWQLLAKETRFRSSSSPISSHLQLLAILVFLSAFWNTSTATLESVVAGSPSMDTLTKKE